MRRGRAVRLACILLLPALTCLSTASARPDVVFRVPEVVVRNSIVHLSTILKITCDRLQIPGTRGFLFKEKDKFLYLFKHFVRLLNNRYMYVSGFISKRADSLLITLKNQR